VEQPSPPTPLPLRQERGAEEHGIRWYSMNDDEQAKPLRQERGAEKRWHSMKDDERSKPRWRSRAAVQIRAQQLRQEHTPAEAILWDRLRNRRLDGFKLRRQHPIGRFIVDFCCVEQRLSVEIDGSVHDQQADYDQARTEWLQTAGYQVIRYSNDQIDQDINAVLADLRQALTHTEHNDIAPSPVAAGEGVGG
jgi:very-short-patch-repair endonuclease